MSGKAGVELVDGLVDDVQRKLNFRDESVRVGAIYTMSYQSAIVATYDYDREKAGGLPKGGFLVAAEPKGDNGFILLRIRKEAKLPNAIANDQTRQQAIEATGNEEPWVDALDSWIANQVSLHGIECRILGTFIDQGEGTFRFAEDTDNFFAVTKLMVWKPGPKTLHRIVNHRHRRNATEPAGRKRVGATRFSAAEGASTSRVPFLLDPTDLLQRRTVYLGMSRSGKSNAMKITAEAIHRLRESNPDARIGQLIFDPNGEYAQDNLQDGPGLHRIHEAIGLQRTGEVETYGLFRPPSDRARTIMKINFFGDQFPGHWEEQAVARAMDQMLAGRDIVASCMADETSRYTSAFRDADLSIPDATVHSRGAQVRYRRSVLVYQTALAAAGFRIPSWRPSIEGLFGQDFIDALNPARNQSSNNVDRYREAHAILSNASTTISWSALQTVCEALNLFFSDRHSAYPAFNSNYISRPNGSGESWAEPRLTSLLMIFQTRNGPRSFQGVRNQHDPSSPQDYAESVVNDLNAGKLVIVDQSTGDPTMNQRAAERIMWRVFQTQQDKFRNAAMAGDDGEPLPGILVYLEEAHNLLPRAGTAEVLRTVWARAAKEGSKMNIGMVLATQAPSSIMSEILSETDNWILAYLNSQNERRVIAGYMDFEDFLEQIGNVSEPGFVRVRTLSLAYTVPVQFERFRLNLPDSTGSADRAISG